MEPRISAAPVKVRVSKRLEDLRNRMLGDFERLQDDAIAARASWPAASTSWSTWVGDWSRSTLFSNGCPDAYVGDARGEADPAGQEVHALIFLRSLTHSALKIQQTRFLLLRNARGER